jgi:hypothetical protein
MLQLQDNTIPAGTRIILNSCTDQDDFAIGMAGMVLDNTGMIMGNPVYWPAIGRDSVHSTIDEGKVHQRAMAPIGAFQVVFCSLPGSAIRLISVDSALSYHSALSYTRTRIRSGYPKVIKRHPLRDNIAYSCK